MPRTIGLLLMLVTLLGMLACGPSTQHEIMKKAEGVETKQQLESALGAPDEVDRLGPIETWTYAGSDGAVEFVITGDKIRLESTKDFDDDEEEEE